MIAGDLNQDKSKMSLRSENGDHLYEILGNLHKSKMQATLVNRSRREIDHIFSNIDMETLINIPNPECSDHIPVIVDL